MKPFDDITFRWDGKIHTIPSDRLWPAIKKFENITRAYAKDNGAEALGGPVANAEIAVEFMRWVGVEAACEVDFYRRMMAIQHGRKADPEMDSFNRAVAELNGMTLPPESVQAEAEIPRGNSKPRRGSSSKRSPSR